MGRGSRLSLGLDNGYNITIALREAWRLGEGGDGGDGGRLGQRTDHRAEFGGSVGGLTVCGLVFRMKFCAECWSGVGVGVEGRGEERKEG